MVFLPTAKQETEDDLTWSISTVLDIVTDKRFSYSLSYTCSVFCNFLRKQSVTHFIMIGGDTMEELKAFVIDKKFVVGLVAGFVLGALHHYFAL